MFSQENSEERVAIVQMNAELRHAQLELLSAQCATLQLRLRFSAEDLVQYAEQDVLRKAIEAASVLNDYYASLEKRLPRKAEGSQAGVTFSEEQIFQATDRVLAYLRGQRERHFQSAVPLRPAHKTAMQPFFAAELLDRIRVVELRNARVTEPAFYPEVKAMGVQNLPQVTHMPSLTFMDVIVFNEKITDRTLFHGLVHAVQFQILGPQRYSDCFVRGFLRTNSHFTVPIESHAFALEAKFAEKPSQEFSVEEQVRAWIREGRY